MARRDLCCTYTGSNTPSINTSGCIIGDGTIGNPVRPVLDSTGNIICGPNGLAVSGIVLSQFSSNFLEATVVQISDPEDISQVESFAQGSLLVGPTLVWREGAVDDPGHVWFIDPSGNALNIERPVSVALSGCLSGDGSAGSPITLQLAPSGNIACGPSGLEFTGGLSGFTCSELNTCDADALQDINYTSPPTDGQALIYNIAFGQWIPSDPFTNFTISDGMSSQNIFDGNILTFSGQKDAVVTVAATDTVIVEVDVCAALSGCSIGAVSDVDVTTSVPTSGQSLNWNGSLWVPSTSAGVAGTPFTCADLSGCSITALLDVSGTPANTNVLAWNSSSSVWEPSVPFSRFNISDGTTNELVFHNQTVLFSGQHDANITISAPDTVAVDVNVCAALGGCSVNALSDVNLNASVSGEVLSYNGASWVNSSIATATSVNTSGCVSGDGSGGNPVSLNLDVSGLLVCTSNGLSQRLATSVTNASPAFINDPTDISDVNDYVDGFNIIGPTIIWQGGSISAPDYAWYVHEDGSAINIQAPASGSSSSFACSDLNSCSVTALSDVSGTFTGSQVMAWNGSSLQFEPTTPFSRINISDGTTSESVFNNQTVLFSGQKDVVCTVSATDTVGISVDVCAALDGCSINALSDVDTTTSAPVSGQLLGWNGSEWVPTNVSVSGGGDAGTPFTCADLSGCSIHALLDVNAPSPSGAQTLTWDSGNGWWEPSTPFTRFNVNDGTNNETVFHNETVLFSGQHDVNITVLSPDTVAIDVDVCSALGGCSVNALSDIDLSASASGQVMTYNGTSWVNSDITVTGGGGSGHTSTFTDNTNGNGLDDCTIVHNDGNGTEVTVDLDRAIGACRQYGEIALYETTGVLFSLAGGREKINVFAQNGLSSSDVTPDQANNQIDLLGISGHYKVSLTGTAYTDTSSATVEFDIAVNDVDSQHAKSTVAFPTSGIANQVNFAIVAIVEAGNGDDISAHLVPSPVLDITFTSLYLTCERLN